MAGIIEVKDQGKLRIYDADNSHYIDIVVPSSVTANRTITIPDASFTVPQADTNTVYTHPNHSGEVTSTADGATVIADNIVDEANLKVSNSPTNGYFLSAQSGDTGGLTWASAGGNMKPAFFAFLSGDQNTSNAGNVKVACNTEVIDTDSKYDNSSNYRFTPTVAGNYMVFMNLYIASGSGALQHGTIKLYKNGSELSFSRTSHRSNHGEAVALSWSGIVPLDSDDYIEMYGQGEGGGQASYFKGGSAQQASSFGAFKIIE